MQKRRRFKQTKSLQDRLSQFVNSERAKAQSMPEGADKTELLKKVRQAETAANIGDGRPRPNCSRRSDRSASLRVLWRNGRPICR